VVGEPTVRQGSSRIVPGSVWIARGEAVPAGKERVTRISADGKRRRRNWRKGGEWCSREGLYADV